MQRRRCDRSPLWLGWHAIAVGIAIAAAVLFVRTPLLDTLGYEAAAGLAVLGSLVGLLFAATARHDDDALTALGHGLRVGGAVVVVVVAAIATRGLWQPTCDTRQALAWLALLTVPSLVLGATLGAVTAYGVSRLAPRWRGRHVVAAGLAIAAWLVVAAGALWRIYHHPTARSYSPWIGYFPGNLYDEYLAIPTALLWARLEQCAWATAALSACAWHRRHRQPRVARTGTSLRFGRLAVVAIAGAATLAVWSGPLEYRLSRHDIERALGGIRHTAHFTIYYDRNDPSVTAAIDDIAREHEFRLHQVQQALGVGSLKGTIRSYYFTSPAQKARWFGARYTEMARPWAREIFLAHAPFPHPSLRHEIAHIVAGELGDPWFAVSARRWHGLPILANPGVIEGSAVMADWPGSLASEVTPHQATAVLQQLGWGPSVAQLTSLAFFGASSAQGYTSAGSLMRYIRDTHGVAAWQAIYRSGGDTEAALGISMGQLETNWRAFLATVELPQGAVEVVRERYARPSVFVRRCPHDVAAMMERMRAGEPDQRAPQAAIASLHAICDLTPSADMLLALGDWARPHDLPLAQGYYYQIARNPQLDASNRGEAYWALAILSLPHLTANVLIDEARQLQLPLIWRRRFTMLDALRRAPPPWQRAVAPYLLAEIQAAPRPRDPLVLDLSGGDAPLAADDAWLGPWLQMRFAAIAQDDARVLQLAPEAFATIQNALYRGAVGRFVVEAAWRAGDEPALQRALDVLAEPTQSAMDRYFGDDWAARRDFYHAYRERQASATSPQQ